MLLDESYEQLKKQSFFHLRIFLFWWWLLTNCASKTFAFTFVCLGKSHFIFLFLFSLVTLSGTNVKGMFCFQKVSCSFYLISAFLLLPQFHFQWVKLTLSFYETKKLEKLVFDLLTKGVWRKIFPRLKNKAFCKRLKRWVEFLLFAQIYAVLNQNNWWAVNHWRQLHILISSSQINQASF